MKRVKKDQCLIVGFLFILAASLWAFADQNKSSGATTPIKPDLWVAKFKAERTGFTAEGAHRVQVKVPVVNSAPGLTCANSFQVLIEKRSGGGAYSILGSQTVARLCSNIASAKLASVTLTFEDIVPAGQMRTWRATADSSNAVDEMNRDNNQRESEPYVAEAFCLGVDIVLTRVEIVRGSDGLVNIKAYGKNRCIGTCSADVQACFEVVDPVVATPGVCANMGAVGPGLQDYESSLLGIYSRTDCAVTYRASIEFTGGHCVDTNPANNSCNVTLGVGENKKIVTCLR